MGASVTFEDQSDQQSESCGIYSPSADISESEFSVRRLSGRMGGACGGASTSMASSPMAAARASAAAAAEMMTDADMGLWDGKIEKWETDINEVEMMKERFAKLLLGEDMSGGGKGVCSALAISNAITNLSATVFGELWRLEPLALEKKSMWLRDMEWLLCISDFIIELVPSFQELPDGGGYEVMVSHPRNDLHLNLPALKKLDAMLLAMLDGFRDTEFWYADGDFRADEDGSAGCTSSSFGMLSSRQEDKWWLPCPQVPSNGLSENARKRLQQCRDCANQILKAAFAINSGVLAEMEVPDPYFKNLPKSGKLCLGDIIYRYLTAEEFSPECVMDCLDLSSEHNALEIANRIEAAINVWRLKDRKRHPLHSKAKNSWSEMVMGLVSYTDRSQFLAQRAESLLHSLRLRYPGLPQTDLDMHKFEYNKDVGQSILESYSRVMESLAFNVMARIDDLIFVDDATKRSAASEAASLSNRGGFDGLPIQKRISPSPFSVQNTPYVSPFATPTFCSSTPVAGSPGRLQPMLSKDSSRVHQNVKLIKPVSGDIERVWSYTGNLSARNDAGDAPERD